MATSPATAGGPSSPAKFPLAFFVLIFAFAIPFWVVGGVTGRQLLPGLPEAALGIVCPVLAALILTYRKGGAAGAAALLKRSFDYQRVKGWVWYLPTLLLLPLVMVFSFAVLRLAGTPVPLPAFTAPTALVLAAVFFVGALGEELGWTGYVMGPLQERWGTLRAGLVLGAVWAVYHYVGLVEAHRSMVWIAWWTLGTLALRVIMAWLFSHTGGSVFAASLFHMMINLTWQLFPVNGSFYDPRVTSIILALTAVIITAVWGRELYRRHPTCDARPAPFA